MSQMLVLVGFIFIFYFLMWRPQSKRAKQHRALIASLDKEDEVVTSGGILGRVVKVTDSFIVLSIAEGIEIPIQKNAVAASLPKGTIKSI
ncbi:MAG TPA: preprotein translocase subunit YajC [Gammaproteobacteria bacterium]|nr:preprotein translocase subunit YajC [Gammaproteobacteria bacterium]